MGYGENKANETRFVLQTKNLLASFRSITYLAPHPNDLPTRFLIHPDEPASDEPFLPTAHSFRGQNRQ